MPAAPRPRWSPAGRRGGRHRRVVAVRSVSSPCRWGAGAAGIPGRLPRAPHRRGGDWVCRAWVAVPAGELSFGCCRASAVGPVLSGQCCGAVSCRGAVELWSCGAVGRAAWWLLVWSGGMGHAAPASRPRPLPRQPTRVDILCQASGETSRSQRTAESGYVAPPPMSAVCPRSPRLASVPGAHTARDRQVDPTPTAYPVRTTLAPPEGARLPIAPIAIPRSANRDATVAFPSTTPPARAGWSPWRTA
jgi:hypothetical protein